MFNRPVARAFKRAIAKRIKQAEQDYQASRKSLFQSFMAKLKQMWADLQHDRQELLDSTVENLLGGGPK